ncbi:hypothetical protein [Ferviditalea candida]|uniref:Uncharacterized protein n=1 Tax=Ferviditalea candida TaxID=3108399 RepID=A0ABU5ZPL3_9BACL|nr:hypothetical protein [Paenibacillaceae bacterium T2]
MKFRRSLRGYDPLDVTTLIESKLQQIDGMIKANEQLRDKLMEFNHLKKVAEKQTSKYLEGSQWTV